MDEVGPTGTVSFTNGVRFYLLTKHTASVIYK